MNIRNSISTFLTKFKRDDSGATAIEYGLFAALIGAVLVVSVTGLGLTLGGGFTSVEGDLATGFGIESNIATE